MAPFSATYFFTLSGFTASCGASIIKLVRNGVEETNHIHQGGDPEYQHLSHQWMTALRAGDEYKLSEKGNIYANPTNPVVFTGQLVYLNE